ncbi:hypothetical protein [Desulfopila aestuarii]|uniref:Hook-length control protein FliK n=1 Tax=Desulfopila aestuarii DSM 18488 TaxID=1121416 RepID=A0A1M7YDY1_9BACT|nr:hypothetical protein [Desulfopila aestuarii]SHO50786.1 hypothetical protein SAMN02745220_03650 [Desulfopila aestuarii DSM 18488]
MKTITPLQSITQYTQSSPATARTPQSLQLPEPGQLLKALVIEARAGNTVILQIGDNLLPARSDMPLQPGQTLQLQLVATSPQIELKIVNDTLQQFLGRPLTLIGNTVDIRELFSLLQQPQSLLTTLSLNSKEALESFMSLQQSSLNPNTENGGTFLKQMVDQIGLAFERMIGEGNGARSALTLKAALLEVLSNFKTDSQIHNSALRSLTTLEFFQLAQLHTESSQQFIFPLPLPFLEQGFLLVEKRNDDDGGGGADYEQQEYRFSLFLKLKELGNLRIDFFHSPEGLLIRFHADSEEKANFIATYESDLKQSISEAPLLGISFGANAPDPATELIRRIVPEGRSVFDTTA